RRDLPDRVRPPDAAGVGAASGRRRMRGHDPLRLPRGRADRGPVPAAGRVAPPRDPLHRRSLVHRAPALPGGRLEDRRAAPVRRRARRLGPPFRGDPERHRRHGRERRLRAVRRRRCARRAALPRDVRAEHLLRLAGSLPSASADPRLRPAARRGGRRAGPHPTPAVADARSFSEMKVVILAGGMGTRLAEETEVKPKPMVPIGGQPILWHIMKYYASFGFREFFVALGYKGDDIKRYFLDYHGMAKSVTVELASGNARFHESEIDDWIVHLIDTGAGTNTGGRLKRLQPWLEDGTFMLTY